jgi:hypothetical protein
MAAVAASRDPAWRPPGRKQQAMRYRQAAANDVAAIASLHAESWRRHYRGAYLDSHLDGDVVADRMAEWSDRLSGSEAG